jgi:hypothetical protein
MFLYLAELCQYQYKMFAWNLLKKLEKSNKEV